MLWSDGSRLYISCCLLLASRSSYFSLRPSHGRRRRLSVNILSHALSHKDRTGVGPHSTGADSAFFSVRLSSTRPVVPAATPSRSQLVNIVQQGVSEKQPMCLLLEHVVRGESIGFEQIRTGLSRCNLVSFTKILL